MAYCKKRIRPMTSSHIDSHSCPAPALSPEMRRISFDVPSVLVFVLLEWVSYCFWDIMNKSLSVNVRGCACKLTAGIGLIVLMCPPVPEFLNTMNGSRSFGVPSCPCFDTL